MRPFLLILLIILFATVFMVPYFIVLALTDFGGGGVPVIIFGFLYGWVAGHYAAVLAIKMVGRRD